MEGTGLSDILLEAGLIGSGSVTGVITGKHYSRAMHCHKILLEALERLLFEVDSKRLGMLSCIRLDQKLLSHTFALPPLLLVLNNEGIPGLPCYL
jgi:hypothetical protein